MKQEEDVFHSDLTIQANPLSADQQPVEEKSGTTLVLIGDKEPLCTEKSPQTCPLCDSIVDDERNLIHHISSIHSNHCLYHCENCDMKFIKLIHLNLHVRENHSNAHYQCDQCEARYTSKLGLLRHQQVSHSSGATFTCSKCDKTFSCSYYLRGHVTRVHNASRRRGRKFSCQYCASQFTLKTSCKLHEMRAHSRQFSYPCLLCERRYKLRVDLSVHMRDVHSGIQYRCEICDKVFTARSYLRAHKRNVHAAGKLKRNPVSKSVPLRSRKRAERGEIEREDCKICHKNILATSMKRHLTSVHKESPEVTHDCHLCDSKFSTTSSLSAHKREKHPDEKPISCHVCYRSFRHYSSLLRHERIHSDERPFQCHICREKFATQRLLNRHRVLHDRGEFPCQLCGAMFQWKQKLKLHLQLFCPRNPPSDLKK